MPHPPQRIRAHVHLAPLTSEMGKSIMILRPKSCGLILEALKMLKPPYISDYHSDLYPKNAHCLYIAKKNYTDHIYHI